MSTRARRRAAILVPWIALAAVTALALWQLASRTGAPPSPAPQTDRGPARPSASEADGERLLAAAQATEKALDEALTDLDRERATGQEAARLERAAAERVRTAQAALALARARVEALDAEREAGALETAHAEAERDALQERVEALETDLKAARDPAIGWLADAESEDPVRRAAAKKAVAKATDEQVTRIAELLDADASRALAVARLVGGLPESDGRDVLANFVLLGEAAALEAPERVRAVGPQALAVPNVAGSVLRSASDAVVRETVSWLAGRELDWTDEFRLSLAGALVSEKRARPATVRAVGVLGLEGVAKRLVVLASHEEAPLRAAAVHALSRIPDLHEAWEASIRAMPRLLDDEDEGVRTAAALLAEALLDEMVEFDPTAGEAERRDARDKILDQLR